MPELFPTDDEVIFVHCTPLEMWFANHTDSVLSTVLNSDLEVQKNRNLGREVTLKCRFFLTPAGLGLASSWPWAWAWPDEGLPITQVVS